MLYKFLTIAFIYQISLYAQSGFPLGVYLDKWDSLNTRMYNEADTLGVNSLIQYANSSNSSEQVLLKKYNLIAIKGDSPEDAVSHYSSGYYSKWEAEDTTINELGTGIKASFGERTVYKNIDCWTSGTAPKYDGSLMLRGPHYRQDKTYLPWYIAGPVDYILKVRIAGKDIPGVSIGSEDAVCKIEVVFSYKQGTELITTVLPDAVTTINAGSLAGGEFKEFIITYSYTSLLSSLKMPFDDTDVKTGIQFNVTWYGRKQIFVDCFEIYDNKIGIDLVNNYSLVVKRINRFAENYKGWQNLSYFFNTSEPQTLDKYIPMRMVDHILDSLGYKPGVAEFYPQWDGWRNGDRTIKKFVETARPRKIMMEFINYFQDQTHSWECEQQRKLLQELSQYSADFWYEAMIALPVRKSDHKTCWVDEPAAEELNASIMLALAHGAKGLMFWKMSHGWYSYEANCNDSVMFKVLLERNGNELIRNTLFNYISRKLSPRINGTLGKVLMGLDYTGNYVNFNPGQNTHSENSFDFFSPAEEMKKGFWHIGFLKDKTDRDRKYFLMVNLDFERESKVDFTLHNQSGYLNLGIRDVERHKKSIDTTISTEQDLSTVLPPGEGYLFEVSPVIKYGGRLLYDEAATDGMTLTDDLIIDNNAVLTVKGTYNAAGNIFVVKGSVKYAPGAKISFAAGKTLIYEQVPVK